MKLHNDHALKNLPFERSMILEAQQASSSFGDCS